MPKNEITHAQVLRRMRKALRKTIVAELAKHGVVLLPGPKVKYGDLVSSATWRFDYGNLLLVARYAGIDWLHARASTPDVNAEEPVYVGLNLSALLGRRS